MIEIINLLGSIAQILTVGLLFLLIRKTNQIQPGIKLEEEKIKSDPFIEDVMHYAFKSNLKPMAMPDQNGKNTLFDTDDDGAFAICELFTTTHKQGSSGYNELLKKITERIDRYVENKIAAKSKKPEGKVNDQNK
jgi:hypothetical protein